MKSRIRRNEINLGKFSNSGVGWDVKLKICSAWPKIKLAGANLSGKQVNRKLKMPYSYVPIHWKGD